ncbi:hypothetical protein [Polyangium jinanense]|uniref:Uncharacterized protein n=1 Tax=Polyangium jinanense TaxID=2829994 RepID=A0A9X3X0U1_9BACT|nr:hypothetical protein [Polyangium jinanense]MDC3954045.1 hypothetical protein [Polyangium jinanense]MDC3981999.1 hypothetical protein [Polyangium jinanense]
MPGSLHHARQLGRLPYRGNDQQEHWEVDIIDGDMDVVSYSSWHELVEYCARLGVPVEVWPGFTREGIDVSLDRVDRMQGDLREALRRLTLAEVSGHVLLARIVGYLARGEKVFFC